MKIVKHEDLGINQTQWGQKVTIFRKGEPDIELNLVKCIMDNGEVNSLFTCNSKPGYFKKVFVPWDFEHPEMI